jgi:signal transduction histidine kinase
MRKLMRTVAFRLAAGYAALLAAAVVVMSGAFYFGTIGVIERGIDAKITSASERLVGEAASHGTEALRRRIDELLSDGIDQDTEVYLLLDPHGQPIVGNLLPAGIRTPLDRLTDEAVTRNGRPSISRLLPRNLPNGEILVVGRDMQDVLDIEHLVVRALVAGGTVALVLAVGGAVALRRILEGRVAAIRRTAHEIEAGDLSRRIPTLDADDEFTRLSADINRMLDRIQHLMAGVRDVSNAVAHDLRTPLGRIRVVLEEALRRGKTKEELQTSIGEGIADIDRLIGVFDKLLQIAEAESGTRRQSFGLVSLDAIITEVVELFDATAEANGMTLIAETESRLSVLGDRHLLVAATANLIDNALKYAGRSATVRIGSRQEGEAVSIFVEDDGPGIPSEERNKVATRFYRLDRSRSQPGNGLGLSIVEAISHLHAGRLSLTDACPGLSARIVLPRADAADFPNGNVMETVRIRAAG